MNGTVTVGKNTVLHIWKLLREKILKKFSSPEKKIFLFLCRVTDVHVTPWDDQGVTHTHQITTSSMFYVHKKDQEGSSRRGAVVNQSD